MVYETGAGESVRSRRERAAETEENERDKKRKTIKFIGLLAFVLRSIEDSVNVRRRAKKNDREQANESNGLTDASDRKMNA
jgi:hypothetical protein